LRFVPEGTGGRPGGPVSNNTGGLPRTGVESIISTLILGLVTSMAACLVVVLVIRHMNAKERRYSK